ncbi:hypothetical protein CBS101457_002366 [Exobasidium rhododendri]|nr:hypothetical protein CBS101457_002366 [Exobasidium rhododendri]
MNQNGSADQSSPSRPSASRPAGSSNGAGSVEIIRRNAGHRHQTSHHQTIDPLIESLDGHDEAESWLNETINLRRAGKVVPTSALHLKVESMNGADSSPSSSNAPQSSSDLNMLESHLSSLSTTLTFSRQDTLSVIDSTISNVTNAIPKLGLELRLMKDAALTLKASIDNLRRQALNPTSISSNDQQASSSSSSSSSSNTASEALQRLSALSTLHSRMSAARDVLSLAESWSTLSADVTSFLSESKFASACSRLAGTKSSLSVFERTPEYESRKILFEGLCDSLIGGILPSLANAVKEKNVFDSQQIAEIFVKIGREDQFAERWRSLRTESWLLQWKNARIGEEMGGRNENATHFVYFVPTAYDDFRELLNEETMFAPSLFPKDPRKSMELFTSSAQLALEPSFQSRLLSSMQQHEHEGLLVLVRIHTAIKDAIIGFSKALSRVEAGSERPGSVSPTQTLNGPIVDHSPIAMSPLNEHKQMGTASQSPISPNATRPRLSSSHSRKLSHRRLNVNLAAPNAKSSSNSDAQDDFFQNGNSIVRQSTSNTLLGYLPEPSDWERILLDPIVEFQLDYGHLEATFLTKEAAKASRANEAAAATAPRMGANANFDSLLLGAQIGNLLWEDCKMVRTLAEDATQRSVSLMYGLASAELIASLDQVYVQIFEKFRRRVEERSKGVVEAARRQASGRLDSTREGLQNSSSVEEDQWKAIEESVGLLSIMHQAEQSIEAVERHVAEQLKDVGEMILNAATTSGYDAMLRLCGHGSPQGTTKTPLAVLIRRYSTPLESGSLFRVLEGARMVARESRNTTSTLVKRQDLLVESKFTLMKQIDVVQNHLIDMTLAPLMSYLELYTQLPIWEASRLPGSVNEYELTMPTFSLSPTEEMSRIGEGLLDLPRLLEAWSDNDDLRWAVKSVSSIALKEKEFEAEGASRSAEQVEASTGSSSPVQSNKRMSFHPSSSSPVVDRRSGSHRHTASLAAIATVPTNISTSPNGENTTPSAEDDSESVLQTYLSLIALSLLSHFTSIVLPSISRLTTAGSSQLVADLEYLLNILSALNVNTSAAAAQAGSSDSFGQAKNQSIYLIRTLEAWKDTCKLKDSDGKRIQNLVRSGQLARGVPMNGIENFDGDEERLRSLASTAAFEMVGRMRGW